MNKKGIGQGTIIFFIIVLASAVVLFVFASNLNATVNKSDRGLSCKTSMTLKTYTSAELGVTTLQGTNEFCPKYKVIFHDKYVEILLKDKLFDKIKYDNLTNDKVNEILAEEMRYCWTQFGAGKLDAFWFPEPLWGGSIVGGMKNDAIGIRVCSEITFQIDYTKHESFTGLKDYLKSHGISTKLKKEGIKGNYYSYIAEHTQGCGENYIGICWEQFALDNDIKIDTNMSIDPQKDYLVVFMRKNIQENKGIMNTYLISQDTMDRLNKQKTVGPLPFV